MATRFAGDFFGISLTTPEEDKSSSLFSYFPELKAVRKSANATGGPTELGPARLYGDAQAVTPFTGFKTFEVSNERKAAPVFTGFKTFEQPTKANRSAASSVPNKNSSVYAKSPTESAAQVDPEVLKSLGLA